MKTKKPGLFAIAVAGTLLAVCIAVPICAKQDTVSAPTSSSDQLALLAMPTTQAASITEANDLRLSEVDVSAGTALLWFGYRSNDGFDHACVQINLLNGKILPETALVPSTRNADSPSDRFTIRTEEERKSVFRILDRQGREISRLTKENAPGFSGVMDWSPTDELFAYIGCVPGHNSERGLFIYSIKARKSRLVLRGNPTALTWTSDGRYIASVYELPDDGTRSTSILDARHGYRQVLKTGVLASNVVFSPSNTRIAFDDRVSDEYGDLDSFELRVADLGTGQIRTLATNRRRMFYVWAGDDTMAVSTRDKYARPSVYLMGVDGKRTTRLVTAPEYSVLHISAFFPKANRVVYIAKKGSSSGDRPEELWAVESGRTPIRLFPKNARAKR